MPFRWRFDWVLAGLQGGWPLAERNGLPDAKQGNDDWGYKARYLAIERWLPHWKEYLDVSLMMQTVTVTQFSALSSDADRLQGLVRKFRASHEGYDLPAEESGPDELDADSGESSSDSDDFDNDLRAIMAMKYAAAWLTCTCRDARVSRRAVVEIRY
jgi:hypothetical protein